MKEFGAADIEYDGLLWTTQLVLPSWRGWTSWAPKKPGLVEIVFANGRDESPLRETEIALVRWAVTHEREMQDPLLRALVAQYRRVKSVKGLRSHIGLHHVNVHPVEKKGVPYVGFEFHCSWDKEHGLGVLMHGTRVVSVGSADQAILQWIAEKDARKR